MARIGENAFRQYRDGQDRLTAPEYMAERELIRLAVNDLDDKVQRTEGIREEFSNTVNEVENVKGEVVQTKQEVETKIGEFTQVVGQASQQAQQAKEEVQEVSVNLERTTQNLDSRGLNILNLGMGIRQDGTNTSQALYNALKYCKDNGYSAFIPKGTYTVGPFPNGDGTSWKCVPIPDGLTLYVETGVRFKLIPGAPAWSRVVVPGNNVKIFGHLEIDGSADTITSGNEHMAGLFLYGVKNFYIESLYAYNCYGDNVQISGDATSKTENCQIDRLYCRKAGRKNLVFEAATGTHIRNAYLDNLEGNSETWAGGGCLDAEPFGMGTGTYHSRIDYLETTNGNDFTAGITQEEASQYRIDIGTLVQKSGTFLVYAMGISIENAHFGEDFDVIDLMYSSDIRIGKAVFKKPKKRVISTQYSGGQTPKLHIDTLVIEGDPSVTPTDSAIHWRGSSIYIGQLHVTDYNNEVISSQYTAPSEFNIGKFVSKNSGSSDGKLIYLSSYSGNRGSMNIDHLFVKDSRAVKPNKIIEYSDALAMEDFKVTKVHNPDNLTLYGTQYGNFKAYVKLAGVDGGLSIFMLSGSPEEAIEAPVGSMALRTDGTAGTTFYIKESGTGSTGWVAK